MTVDVILATAGDLIVWGIIFAGLLVVALAAGLIRVAAHADRTADAAWRARQHAEDEAIREAIERWSR